VTFHDGTPFTAEDVAFSFERAMAPDSVNAQPQLFEGINSVNVIDDLTVELGLDAPKASLLFNLAWGDAVIVSPASAETNRTRPVGTGPFRFERWVQGDRVELVAYDDYWGEAPALERVVFRFISDPTAAYAAMMAGDVDAFPVFPAPENLAQFEADPRFEVIVGTTEGETILAMNHAREPFDDIRVRQAIAHAIDRQAIIDGAMFGYGTPIGSHFAPHHPAYVDLTDLSPARPRSARALLPRPATATASRATLGCRRPPMPGAAARSSRASCAQVGIEARW
jgi:peptide/nickel transport system substrate-binding protein